MKLAISEKYCQYLYVCNNLRLITNFIINFIKIKSLILNNIYLNNKLVNQIGIRQ